MENKLKWWRHELHIDTQIEFAELLGVTRQQVNYWEQQRGQPNVEMARQIAVKLSDRTGRKVYIDDLFDWGE